MKSGGGHRVGCDEIEGRLASFAAGALDEASERTVRDHLAGCEACRADQMQRDPAAIFLGLRRSGLPDGFLDNFSRQVRRRIEEGARPRYAPFGGWLPVPGHRRLAYLAAPLLMILLVGTLYMLRPTGPRGGRASRTGQPAISSALTPPPAGAQPVPTASEESQGAASGPEALAAAAGMPLLEEVGSPSARVYRFSVESNGDETPIYFVVDESIDI